MKPTGGDVRAGFWQGPGGEKKSGGRPLRPRDESRACRRSRVEFPKLPGWAGRGDSILQHIKRQTAHSGSYTLCQNGEFKKIEVARNKPNLLLPFRSLFMRHLAAKMQSGPPSKGYGPPAFSILRTHVIWTAVVPQLTN